MLAWGVGSFTQGSLQVLKEDGAQVATYLSRDYAHYPPSLAGPTFSREQYPNPCQLIRERKVDLVLPMSIDWAQQSWSKQFRALQVSILSPTEEGMLIERERDFGRRLCRQFHVPYPEAHLARNRLEAEALLAENPLPYVIKNPLCSPTSPIHTIVCETLEDTCSWLPHLNYAEGVFFQEYLGRAEAGHIALVSGGEIYSLVTNQEYKRAFDGNMGIVAGAPLGGLVEQDPRDRYGLARSLLHPLLPWFRKVRYAGPIQVTAVRRRQQWQVIEYNIRLGITSGPMILRMLSRPLQVLLDTAQNRKLDLQFRRPVAYGCSLTLAGYGYPYTQVRGPHVPVEQTAQFNCDVWWNEVAPSLDGGLCATGHRLADVVAIADTLEGAIAQAYENIRKIRCLGSYYRTDVGRSLWPPGSE